MAAFLQPNHQSLEPLFSQAGTSIPGLFGSAFPLVYTIFRCLPRVGHSWKNEPEEVGVKMASGTFKL
jgi:hypothetical protein